MKYTPIPTDAIQNENLNEREFHTYCKIMTYCWKSDKGSFDWILPTSMNQFAKDLGKPRTTLIDHLRTLSMHGLIKVTHISPIAFTLIPTATVHQPTELSTSRPIIIKDLTIREGILSEEKEEDVHQPTPVHQPTVDAEIVEYLRLKGVAEPMRSYLASRDTSLQYIQKWFLYFGLKGEPISHALVAIRDSIPEPEICMVCHAVDGNHRGVVDEESMFMMCPREDRPDLNVRQVVEMFGEVNPVTV